MAAPILTTKLYIPPPRPNLVLRPRLIDRLNAGLHGKLTLISAPAGFGKTTLVSAWVAEHAQPVAWLSLDEADADPKRFLTYLVAALQTIAASMGVERMGESVTGALQSPQPPPPESILTALLNEIATIPNTTSGTSWMPRRSTRRTPFSWRSATKAATGLCWVNCCWLKFGWREGMWRAHPPR